MGINTGMDIGNSLTLDDFKNFVNGDNKPFDSTVIRLSPNDGERKLCTTHRDFVGNVGRRQATQDQNNAVRLAFMNAVAGFFGGRKEIPGTVKKAMKMEDYVTDDSPSGKPLTARRIRATLTAIKLYNLSQETGLSLEDVSNPVVTKQLDESQELRQGIKNMLESLPTGVPRKTMMEYIVSALTNPKVMNPLPFGKYEINNDPKINKAFEKSINEIFDMSVKDRDKDSGPYSPDELRKQATADIYRGGGITTGKGSEITTVWDRNLKLEGKTIEKSKIADDCMQLLVDKVFDGNSKDAEDSLPIFNQGVQSVVAGEFPVLMKLGTDLTSFGMSNGGNALWKNFHFTKNPEGSYHVQFTAPYELQNLISHLPGDKFITIPFTAGSKLKLTADYDMYRDGKNNFRVGNMRTKVNVELNVDTSGKAWKDSMF